MSLYREKLEQAQALLTEFGLDAWLIVAQESGDNTEPALELVAGTDVVWLSAFIVTSDRAIALVGRYDADKVAGQQAGWDVRGYDQDLAPPLRAALVEALGSRSARIGLNYAQADPLADGLSHGNYLWLDATLRDTPYHAGLSSAALFLSELRSRKTPAEIKAIKAACATTISYYDRLAAWVQPGHTEKDIFNFLHELLNIDRLVPAWDAEGCPTVNVGPDSPPGHTLPSSKRVLAPGMAIHIDFGIRQNGYSSDLQRNYYYPRPGERQPPQDAVRAHRVCREAIEIGRALLKPGVTGWQVDAAARAHLVAQGYPEYLHALGHGLGRRCHDGGALLGPRWARYGETPNRPVPINGVYTLELGVHLPGYGYIGLEEDVLVTENGAEYIAPVQDEIGILGQHQS